MKRTDSCGSKILDFKQTKPFRPARQDDRDIFDWGLRHWYRRCADVSPRLPQTLLLSSIMRTGGLKPVDLSAAPVSIFERRYFRTILATLSCGCGRTPEHPIARAI